MTGLMESFVESYNLFFTAWQKQWPGVFLGWMFEIQGHSYNCIADTIENNQ